MEPLTDNVTIQYVLTLPGGARETIDLLLDGHLEVLHQNTAPNALPAWTALNYHQCPNCPLSVLTHPRCALAVNLVDVMRFSNKLISHDEVLMEVITQERRIIQRTTAQRAISSLMGLIVATSGCPHSTFLRPMARFHLPLASEEETIYRATSMYLLAQYFLRNEERAVDFSLEGLVERYKILQKVNLAIAERLRAASETDASINAVVLLDIYAKTMPYAIKDSLEDIRYLFSSYF